MKKILVIALVVISSAFTIIAEDWKSVTVVDKVTVSMPTEPVEVSTGGAPQKVKKCTMSDSTELGAILLDLTLLGLTEEQIDALKDTEDFKEQIKMGITQSGGEIKSESEGKHKDKYLYYQFDLEVPNKAGKKVINTTRMVFVKKYAITLTYQAGSAGEKKEIKDQYFNSLAVAE